MKRFLLTIVLVLVAASATVSAQLLWKIEGPGLKKPSYIFGTHHVAPAEVASRWGLESLMDRVDRVVGEIDLIHGGAEEAQTEIGRLSMAPADSTLSVMLGEEGMLKLGNVAGALMGRPVPPSSFNLMKPAMVSTLLSMMQARAAFPTYDHETQLDALVLGMAERKGVPTSGLESPKFQAQLLLGEPIAKQAADLLRLLDNSRLSYEKARELADAYVAGDLDTMWRIINEPVLGATPDEVDRLIVSRNAGWIKILCAMIPTASVLVVVGAGHLPGPDGLIEMFRRQGYSVTPQTPTTI